MPTLNISKQEYELLNTLIEKAKGKEISEPFTKEADEMELKNALESIRIPKDTRQTFCELWPSARDALDTMKGLLSRVSGVGFFASAAINTVISTGDIVSKSVCR